MATYLRNKMLPTTSFNSLRKYCSSIVLGIETSCDDTAAAIVRKKAESNKIVSEKLCSQHITHNRFGGIIPPIAQDHHRQNIEAVVSSCLEQGDTTLYNIDAIAVTNRPGLPMSLEVGLRYAKHLSRLFKKPIIPIHHMEAHALVVRLTESIPFPFICLLISGGHCQLVFVQDVNTFYMLGETIDDAPGEVLDKIARRLKLRNLPGYEDLNGGRAIERAASQVDQHFSLKYTIPVPLQRYRDCQFSFAGIKNNSKHLIDKIEAENGTSPDEVIPVYKAFCKSLLVSISTHLCQRVQRCIEYCLKYNLLSCNDPRSLVISGGVAANDFIFDAISETCSAFHFKTYRPVKSLCTDNGVMIAWNGIEKLAHGLECFESADSIKVYGKFNLGKSLIPSVKEADIKCSWVKWQKMIIK